MSTRKHIPQRTCIACRKVGTKRELIRLVRIADGSIEIDTSGKKAGRGAYICRARDCWQSGLKGGRLERALRATISQGSRESLISYGEDLLHQG
jgi:predicted RNA-binding protein YlxR (DUF448 family)